MKIKSKRIDLLIILILSMMFISYTLSLNLKGISNDIKDLFVYYYSYSFLTEKFSILKIIKSVLNNTIMISIFAEYLWIELDRNASYIFTRTRKTKEWITRKFIEILRDLIIIQFIQFIFAFLYFYILGFRIIHLDEFILVNLQLFILITTTQYILIIIANLLMLKVNQVFGYIVSISLNIVSLLILYSLYGNSKLLVAFIPFTQYLISIQDNILINRSIPYFMHYIKDYSFYQALIYNAFFIGILILLGRKLINKHEFY